MRANIREKGDQGMGREDTPHGRYSCMKKSLCDSTPGVVNMYNGEGFFIFRRYTVSKGTI